MLRLALALMLVAVPLALPIAAAGPTNPCVVVDCPRPIVGVNDQRACAGVGFSTGGTAVCYVFDGNCVQRHFGFAYSETCLDDVGRLLGGPIVLP